MTKPVVERMGSLYRVTWEAPAGQVWKARGVHELVEEGRGPFVKEALADIKASAALGLEPCPDPDCAWCEESV